MKQKQKKLGLLLIVHTQLIKENIEKFPKIYD